MGDSSCQSAAQLQRSGSSVYTTGSFTGTLDLGNGVVLASSTQATFVARFDKTTLSPLWAAKLQSAGTLSLQPIQVDASGQVLLAGSFSSSVTLAGTTLSTPSGTDGFVARLDGATGALLWLVHVDGAQSATLQPAVLGGDGNLLVAGQFQGSLSIGGTTVSSPSGRDGYVGKLQGSTGALLWLTQFDGTGQVSLAAPIEDASGNLLVSGVFSGGLTVGGVTLPNPSGQDAFVGKLDGATGARLWLAHLDGSLSVAPLTPVEDASGNVIISGQFQGALTLGSASFPNNGGRDGFVGKLDGATGARLWLSLLDSTSQISLLPPVLDGGGHVLLTGAFFGGLTVGGAALSSPSGRDGFAAKLDGASGARQWLVHLDARAVRDASSTPAGRGRQPHRLGAVPGSLHDRGHHAAQRPESMMSSWARLSGADGSRLWLTHLDGTGTVFIHPPVLDSSGLLTVSGGFSGNLTAGSVTLSNPSSEDGFVMKLQGTSGVPTWVLQLKGSNAVASSPPQLDATGNVFLWGSFDQSLSLGSGAPPGERRLHGPVPHAGLPMRCLMGRPGGSVRAQRG